MAVKQKLAAAMMLDPENFWHPLRDIESSDDKWQRLFKWGAQNWNITFRFRGEYVVLVLFPYEFLGSDLASYKYAMARLVAMAPLLAAAKAITNKAESEHRELTESEVVSLRPAVSVICSLTREWAERLLANHISSPDADSESCVTKLVEHVRQLSLFEKTLGEVVYLQTDGEFIKIGRTRVSASTRRRHNQTGNPRHITTLAIIPRAIEAKMHERFRQDHVRGEWYRQSPDLMAFIKAWQLVEGVF